MGGGRSAPAKGLREPSPHGSLTEWHGEVIFAKHGGCGAEASRPLTNSQARPRPPAHPGLPPTQPTGPPKAVISSPSHRPHPAPSTQRPSKPVRPPPQAGRASGPRSRPRRGQWVEHPARLLWLEGWSRWGRSRGERPPHPPHTSPQHPASRQKPQPSQLLRGTWRELRSALARGTALGPAAAARARGASWSRAGGDRGSGGPVIAGDGTVGGSARRHPCPLWTGARC